MATGGVGTEIGNDIEDTCGKCGDVWHVVMAKVGTKIVKVVCKRCGGQHNYRSANAAAPAGAAGAKRAPARPRAKSAEPPAPVVPPFDPSKPPRPYSPREAFTLGERIVHPSFGTGIVSGTSGPGKVDVVFPSGARTMACAKAGSTLERPVAVDVPISDRPPDKIS